MIRFTKAKPGAMRPVLKSENTAKASILERLRAFLDGAEPEAVMFLYRNLLDLSNAVTYKELREAYLSGGISDEQFMGWQHEYAKLVRASLLPGWEQAQREAAEAVRARFPVFAYEPSASAGLSYLRQHAAELVTNLAQDQKDAINAMILHVSAYTAVTPDEAARIIRPCIGLTRPQALANLRYREAVESAYLKAHPRGKPETAKKKAKEAAAKYGARQHRYRSMCIARTELAFGYNAAHYGATKDAQAQGLIGDCVKRWLTAFDERVCPICSQMDEEAVNMDAMFSCGTLLPPAHPHCRCGVAYEEIEKDEEGLIDVTDEYFRNATPGIGKYIIPTGRKFKNREKDNMSLIYKLFGGDIEALAEIRNPRTKNPDFRWRGHYWEDQEPVKQTQNAVDKNTQEAIHQIESDPGGILLDIGESKMPLEQIKDIMYKRLKRTSEYDCDLVLIRKRKVECVLRYKK